jgi:von Willebrand factor type A C-terminal domain/von Willebrand factor type A domain
MSRFTADIYQNEFLAIGATDVDAIVTVTAVDGGGAPAPGPARAAEVIIIDTSGSMSSPSSKLKAATQATAAAIDAVRDGVLFGVIAGSEVARAVFPARGGLVAASGDTRAQAKAAVRNIFPSGGTAIGHWLELASDLFERTEVDLRHAILLTDGQNQHETRKHLDGVLAECEGVFQCDCRGVGTDWDVDELRRISSALLGTVDIIARPEDMVADFRAMTERAMGRSTADVALRLWTPKGAEVAFVKQVAPSIADLTDRATAVDALTADYPTGAWGDEARDYHVSIRVPAREVGDEVLAGRLGLVVDGQTVTQALIRAIWTEDGELSTRINPEIAHYTGQAELADVIQEGLEARRAGDDATATFKLGRAVQLATEGGNDGTLQLLNRVLEIDDPATGTVRLKRHVEEVDEMSLDTRSTKTVRVHSPGP